MSFHVAFGVLGMANWWKAFEDIYNSHLLSVDDISEINTVLTIFSFQLAHF